MSGIPEHPSIDDLRPLLVMWKCDEKWLMIGRWGHGSRDTGARYGWRCYHWRWAHTWPIGLPYDVDNTAISDDVKEMVQVGEIREGFIEWVNVFERYVLIELYSARY